MPVEASSHLRRSRLRMPKFGTNTTRANTDVPDAKRQCRSAKRPAHTSAPATIAPTAMRYMSRLVSLLMLEFVIVAMNAMMARMAPAPASNPKNESAMYIAPSTGHW